MSSTELNTLHHSTFNLSFHLVLVTKYRKKLITSEILKELELIFAENLSKWECKLIEFNGENNHVHILFSANPKLKLSELVNNLKTTSSRRIRNKYPHLKEAFNKPVFWSPSYCILSCGGAPISIIKQYIENQSLD